MKKIKGVILAAGKGTRINPLSDEVPKPILPVCNRPLIEYQIEMMHECGIVEVYIVISAETGAIVVETLGDGTRFGMQFRYVEQKSPLGTAHALGILEDLIRSPILVFLGDIFLVIDDLQPLVDEVLSGKANALLLSKIENDPAMIMRNYAIHEDDSGRVIRVIEKPRHPSNCLKGCGVYIFDQWIFDAVRRTPRTAMRNEYEITDSIQAMIDLGLVVFHRPVVTFDMNLTFPHELLELNLTELKRCQMKNIIGKNARIPSGAFLENVVIGEESIVKYPIEIKNSIIFPGVKVDSRYDIEKVIMIKSDIIKCDL
jgi:dTDP-glucose pyrophosphorylase